MCGFCYFHTIHFEKRKITTRRRSPTHYLLGRGFDTPHFHKNAHPTLQELGGLRFVRNGGYRKTEAVYDFGFAT